MTARIDNFEGLHVLLVTEDEARAQAIAKSLRERKAHVGDVRAGAKDPVAMRGADLLVIDARRAPSTDARVAEVRSDVRARWASVASIDYTTLATVDGTVDLRALEGIVSRLAGMDKALTERARKEATFETTLAPLGPTRTLRALALAGPTLHVELTDGELTAKVDLADELLVSAFAERKGEKWEAWHALARVLGMTDANVTVQHRSHPAAMNIMEPVDQALEGAAQERVRAPHLFVESAEELSGLRAERGEVAVAQSAVAAASSSAAAAAPSAAPRAASSAGSRNVISVPAATTASAKPGVLPAAAARRDAFSDTPTDAAAPGLLQRMARSPANDSSDKPKADPELSFDRGIGDDDSDFEGEEEYDQGEVTVVADASQLDILRETLGRYDAEAAAKPPLTSTMPAPRGNAPADADDLELGDALRAATEAADAMNNEAYFGSSPPARGSQPSEDTRAGKKASAPSLTVAANSLPPPAESTPPAPEAVSGAQPAAPAAAASASVPSARPVKTAAATPTLRLDGAEGVRSSKPGAQATIAPKKARTYIMVALVLMALAAVGLMLWSQQQNRAATKARAKQPASAPAGDALKR